MRVAPLEEHDPGWLHRRRSQVVDDHSELGEGQLDPRLGRPATRRPVDEVDDRRRQRADGDGGDRTGRHGRLHEHHGDPLGGDEPPTEVAERPAEVRRGRRDRRRRDHQCPGWEHRGSADVGKQIEDAAAVVHDEGGDQRGDQQPHHRRCEHVTGERPPTAQHGDHEEHERVEQRHPKGGVPQRFEDPRQRADQVDEFGLEGVGHLGEADADRQRDGAADGQGDVGRSACPPLGLRRRVQLEAAAEQTPRLIGRRLVRHERIIWLGHRSVRGPSRCDGGVDWLAVPLLD